MTKANPFADKPRYYIEVEGRRIRLINTVKLVFVPEGRDSEKYASSYCQSQALHWAAYLAERGQKALLVPTARTLAGV